MFNEYREKWIEAACCRDPLERPLWIGAQAINGYCYCDAPSGRYTYLEGRSGDDDQCWRFGTSYEELHTH